MQMATLTIRNVPERTVRRLKALARLQNKSMEQFVRALLEEQTDDRTSVIRQIEASTRNQKRKPSAAEINEWISIGRSE